MYNCTYFYAPDNATVNTIRSNLKHGATVWVGIYKTGNSDTWTSLSNGQYDVWDSFATYCVEMNGRFSKPRTIQNCGYRKPCLCASKREEKQ